MSHYFFPALMFFFFCQSPASRTQKSGAISNANHFTLSTTAAPTFETASIKPSDPNSNDFAITPNPNSFQVRGAKLKYLVQFAYDLQDYQVEGGPAWVSSERFDIIARSDPADSAAGRPETYEERQRLLQQRLQALLTERFHLKVHRETKIRAGYALVFAKGGPKMQLSDVEGGYTFAQGLLICKNFAISDLASMLSKITGRSVVDETDDTKHYAFTLKWSTDEHSNDEGAPPALFTALQEQLGLLLQGKKLPDTSLVIDTVTHPSAN